MTKQLSLCSCVEDQTYACFVLNILIPAAGKVVRGEGPERCSEPIKATASPGDLCSVLSPPSLPTHFLKMGCLCLCEQISEKSNLHQRCAPGKQKREQIGPPCSLFSLSFYLSHLLRLFPLSSVSLSVCLSFFSLLFSLSCNPSSEPSPLQHQTDLRTGDSPCFLHLLSLGINSIRHP